MKTQKYLSITLVLLPCITYSMNIVKTLNPAENPQLIALIFNNRQPSDLLKNNRSFGEQLDEEFDSLTTIVSPKVVTFIKDNPENNTAQGMNRSLNLVAAKMAYFIGENSPILQQDPLAENPNGNPIHGLFNQSARVSRDTLALLLPIDYFLNREKYLEEKLAAKADLTHRAFLRSVEQLGITPQEMVYIDEGKLITDQEADQMTSGMDILGSFATKAEFFRGFKKKIKKTKVIDLVDEMADVKTAGLLKHEEILQEFRENTLKEPVTTSVDATLAILLNEQEGCSFKSGSGFKFACSNEPQLMVNAIRDHKSEMLQRIRESINAMRTEAEKFDVDPELKKIFNQECEDIEELTDRAIERTNRLQCVLAEDARIIGPRAYALSNLYGTISNWAKNKDDKKAESNVHHSFGMFRFMSSQE